MVKDGLSSHREEREDVRGDEEIERSEIVDAKERDVNIVFRCRKESCSLLHVPVHI